MKDIIHIFVNTKYYFMELRKLFICLILLMTGVEWGMAHVIKERLTDLTKTFRATVGVAVIKDNKTIVTLNNEEHYPLMSVFKFHVAVAVLDKMAREHVSLNDSLLIRASEIKENTYSPLRKKVPHGERNQQIFKLPFHTLLYYSIALSDNNACDILIRYVGGISQVRRFMKHIGIKGLHLTETESSMHEDIMKCYNNWSTPISVAGCLKKVCEGDVLQGEYKKFLVDTMLSTTTGAEKIKAGLPVNTPFAHKTGSSDRLSSGIMIGDNDAGIVNPASSNRYYIVILIKDSEVSSQENAALFRSISKTVYDYLQHRANK